jgi:hypothetical protein
MILPSRLTAGRATGPSISRWELPPALRSYAASLASAHVRRRVRIAAKAPSAGTAIRNCWMSGSLRRSSWPGPAAAKSLTINPRPTVRSRPEPANRTPSGGTRPVLAKERIRLSRLARLSQAHNWAWPPKAVASVCPSGDQSRPSSHGAPATETMYLVSGRPGPPSSTRVRSCPVTASHTITVGPAAVAMNFPSGDQAACRTMPSCRNRSVPNLASVPGGSSLPYQSCAPARGGGESGGACARSSAVSRTMTSPRNLGIDANMVDI